jgi:ATP-dependent Zn protease
LRAYDEIDNIGSRNGGTNGSNSHKNDDYWASLINRLLELLDGTAKTDGVIIIGATNRPEKIDKALLRSGRLEKHIIIPPPDAEALIGRCQRNSNHSQTSQQVHILRCTDITPLSQRSSTFLLIGLSVF